MHERLKETAAKAATLALEAEDASNKDGSSPLFRVQLSIAMSLAVIAQIAAGANLEFHENDLQEDPVQEYSGPDPVTVLVNGKKVETRALSWTYDDVVVSHYGTNGPVGRGPTITYGHMSGLKKVGILLPGESVEIEDGMVFNVAITTGGQEDG